MRALRRRRVLASRAWTIESSSSTARSFAKNCLCVVLKAISAYWRDFLCVWVTVFPVKALCVSEHKIAERRDGHECHRLPQPDLRLIAQYSGDNSKLLHVSSHDDYESE
jgi:hypothetical protein